LQGLPEDQLSRIHRILQGFLGLSPIKDIGPASFIDMARFSRQYVADDALASTNELAFQLFYSYLLPQFEGITQPQDKELFGKVSRLVGDRNRDRLRSTLNQVLGLTLQPRPLLAEDDTDDEAATDDAENDHLQSGDE
jgi:hypothetical protein